MAALLVWSKIRPVFILRLLIAPSGRALPALVGEARKGAGGGQPEYAANGEGTKPRLAAEPGRLIRVLPIARWDARCGARVFSSSCRKTVLAWVRLARHA